MPLPAPIVLFVYNRPDHTRQTLDALAANPLATQSSLFIYCDAAKNTDDSSSVEMVRDIAHKTSGFKKVTVIERDTNYGLSRNITDGVSEVCNREGRVIVLEDDIVTSPVFLEYMNLALEQYKNNLNVWHISGWNYPIDANGYFDAFFWRVMNCWGWATWSDRWQHFNKDPQTLVKTWNKNKIRRFNLDGKHDFWRQVKGNYTGKINTWAIFWYATIFEQNGLCINPAQSFVTNIGLDGSGEQCEKTDQPVQPVMAQNVGKLPLVALESQLAVQIISKYMEDNASPGFVKKTATRIQTLLRNTGN